MTNVITSAQNPLIKHIKQLATSAKYRQKNHQTILDGIHLCDAYLRAGFVPEQVIVGTESLRNPEVSGLLFRLDESVPVAEVPSSLYERLSVLEQGVALLFVIALPEKRIAARLEADALLLDTVQDPGNVGAMLRTTAAAGVDEVYLSTGSAAVWSPKVLRAGMGAHFTLRIYENVDLAQLVTNTSVPVVATSLDATQSLYEKDLSAPHAWLFGNEGTGVSEELLKLCEKDTVIIPQTDGVESLNVAAATAVCLFEQRRQRL
ncbi:RNA methyltransferase [Candidatus Saccharibacteria bacterium TM7i]|nr:RNA methyltransferase [Candidatus Saccharibacteria bacterium TM7i]